LNNLDNLYRLQREDGYQSMAYRIETEQPAFGERINPPLFAWAEWEHYLVTGDASRFEKVMPRLIRLYDWIRENRTRVSGLYWFEDTGSSGMDNAPRSGYASSGLNGSDICFVDLACQQALSARCISKMADCLNRQDVAEDFTRRHRELARLINARHWSDRSGFYFDVFGRDCSELRHNFLNHKTVAGFWPILSDVADRQQIQRLKDHLLNPDEFWSIHPVPSLSRDDPNYESHGGYWLGGVWAPTNYMVVRGLEQRGEPELAYEIAVRHLRAMVDVWRNPDFASIWEAYAPDFMRPANWEGGDLVRSNFVGWSGLGPIAMLIENIFGMDFDAPRNRIKWQIRVGGDHGISNLRFNTHTVSLRCQDQDRAAGRVKILIETSGPVDVVLSVKGSHPEYLHSLEVGRHEIQLPQNDLTV